MLKTWKILSADDEEVERLAREMEVPHLLARLLIQRGLRAPDQVHGFLCSDLSDLAPPERMADLPQAVVLLRRALRAKKPIFIVGDYDVDGLTGTALLFRLLASLGGKVDWHIPHRMEDGYGLKEEVIRKAAASGYKLLVTVDCGTTSFKELSLARRLGMETIVVDHHELAGGRRPDASAFLNPLAPGCRYPFKGLASVGVAFALARGLWGRSQKGHPCAQGCPKMERPLWDHLDLVALGTVADMAPLTGENRILVRAGLHALSGSSKPGIQALLSEARLKGEELTSEDVSFSLAPRLNALGRLGSPVEALKLLITEDRQEACGIARRMGQENRQRGELERQALRRALAKVEREVNFKEDRVIVLHDERWHPGVAGIVATRIARRFVRPCVVIACEGEVGRGSARSVAGFDILKALESAREHLVEFGGHPQAAGLTIARQSIEVFRQKLNQHAHERLEPQMLIRHEELEAELPLAQLTSQLLRDLAALAPFGFGNPTPLFLAQDGFIKERPVRVGARRVRFSLGDAEGRLMEAWHSDWNEEEVGFGIFQEGPVALAYSPVCRRRFLGDKPIQLRVRGIRRLGAGGRP